MGVVIDMRGSKVVRSLQSTMRVDAEIRESRRKRRETWNWWTETERRDRFEQTRTLQA